MGRISEKAKLYFSLSNSGIYQNCQSVSFIILQFLAFLKSTSYLPQFLFSQNLRGFFTNTFPTGMTISEFTQLCKFSASRYHGNKNEVLRLKLLLGSILGNYQRKPGRVSMEDQRLVSGLPRHLEDHSNSTHLSPSFLTLTSYSVLSSKASHHAFLVHLEHEDYGTKHIQQKH